MAIKPSALIAVVGGSLVLYSGVMGKSFSSAFRNVLMGESPKNATLAHQIQDASAPTGSLSGVPSVSSVGSAVAPAGPGMTANAIAILKTLRAPVTQANIQSLVHWQTLEGANSYNNPLNTTLHTSGSVGVFNSVGVQEYSSPTAGIQATVATLESGYGAIIAALRAGNGLSGGGGEVAAELSKWSGGGYSSV
jgi:hypothetical protein